MRKKKTILLILALFIISVLTSCSNNESSDSAVKTGTGSLTVKCYNVGKGDAFLIKTDNSAVMIDTGYKSNGDDIVADLKSNGIESLDCLMISHFDKDHVGGAAKIINKLDVKRIITTYQTNDSKQTVKFFNAVLDNALKNEVIREQTSFDIDNVTYKIYPAEKLDYTEKDDNNSSLLVKMTFKDFSMLFTGDAEDERLSEYSEYTDLKCTVLKVPYHGHLQNRLPELVQLCTPKYAVITSSDEEPEDAETLEILEQAGVETYLTRNGDVIIETDGKNTTIKQ